MLRQVSQQVSVHRIEAHIRALVDFGTRHTNTTGNARAKAWLTGQLAAVGLTAEEDPFTAAGGWQGVNLIARKPGETNPDVVWIFSAHYDSTSDDWPNSAPGADDNASGVAAVLEAARILAPMRFAESLWFVFTAAEEQGSKGSAHLAQWLTQDAVDVRGVMAPDMIAYWPLGDDDLMDILGDAGSEHLADEMAEVADLLGVRYKKWIRHDYCYGDDHTSFQESGIPAISPMDCVEAHNIRTSGEHTPHYHRTSDTVDSLYLPFTARVVGVLVSTFAKWGKPIL